MAATATSEKPKTTPPVELPVLTREPLESAEDFTAYSVKATALSKARKAAFPTLESKIGYMQTALETLAKDEKNESLNWGFTSIRAVVEAVKRLQLQLGMSIRFAPDISTIKESQMQLANGGYSIRTSVDMTMTITDLDSNEVLCEIARGEAHDPFGKSLNQAYTFGRRYALINTFNIVMADDTGDGDKYSNRLGAPPNPVPAEPAATRAPGPADASQATRAGLVQTLNVLLQPAGVTGQQLGEEVMNRWRKVEDGIADGVDPTTAPLAILEAVKAEMERLAAERSANSRTVAGTQAAGIDTSGAAW